MKRSSAQVAVAQTNHQSVAYTATQPVVSAALRSSRVSEAWDATPPLVSVDQHPLIPALCNAVHALEEGLLKMQVCLELHNREQAQEHKRQCKALASHLQRNLEQVTLPENLALRTESVQGLCEEFYLHPRYVGYRNLQWSS